MKTGNRGVVVFYRGFEVEFCELQGRTVAAVSRDGGGTVFADEDAAGQEVNGSSGLDARDVVLMGVDREPTAVRGARAMATDEGSSRSGDVIRETGRPPWESATKTRG